MQRARRCEARCVGLRHEVRQELVEVRERGVDGHLVLPLKLCPHGAEGFLGAGSGPNVVHDVQVDVAQVDVRLLGRAAVLKDDGAKDVACFRAADLWCGEGTVLPSACAY